MKILHLRMMGPEFDRCARELGHEVESVTRMDPYTMNKALQRALADPPDLVFIQIHAKGPEPDWRLVGALKDAGVFVVEWFGDVRDPLPQCYVDRMPYVNVTACTNYPDVNTMHEMGHDARFLQIGYDETIYKVDGPKWNDPKDVVFIGNNYGKRFPLSEHRAKVVRLMHQHFGDRFAVYGRGWGKGSHAVGPEEEAAIYRSCKVALNLDHFYRDGFYSDRLLRATGCGAYVVDLTDVNEHLCIKMAQFAVNGCGDQTLSTSVRLYHTWHDRINTLHAWTIAHHEEASSN